MIRRYSFRALILTVALALTAGSSLFAQTKKPARRPRPAKAAATTQMAGLGFGTPESLSGTVQVVAADQNLLVVKGPNGVPYDLKVTPKTLVVVNEKRGTIESLATQVGKAVTVAFVPQREGDFATRVEITD
ncbi:MAG TPA: hypothetical protein VNJ12_11815 [Candidatus Dormibacteraeota bacterium]|nr:hypothetical protein [Candidatus Dormibacteraeota bacterium]